MIICLLVSVAAFAFFTWNRLKRYLQIFQQDEYDNSRFMPWIIRTSSFDKRVSIVLAVLAVASLFFHFLSCAVPIVFVIAALLEPDPVKLGKKPLVMTQRAKRIFYTAFVFNPLIGMFVASVSYGAWLWIVAVQLIPLTLCLAKIVLQPRENSIQKGFREEAQTKLKQINPKVIGITGSFGKTSVKHILGNILNLNAKSFFTPGGINTVMGISRVIREQMPSDCEFFIAEMGAYGKGSIKRLCDFTPPSVGIITAIGEAHYERFKDLDNVARTKFELAEAVLSHPDGKMIVHSSVLVQPYAQEFVNKSRDRFTVCGPEETADVVITHWEQTDKGLSVSVKWNNTSYQISAPIFGQQHVGNLAVSFAASVVLGISAEYALHALQVTPQIKHRLEIKPQANGITYIDDAYNSNEAGFTAAVECLSQITKNGRRILVTPGLVELGAKHDEIHRKLGALSAKNTDVAIVVKAERIPTFLDGFNEENPDGELLEAPNLDAALAWVNLNAQSGDVILLENDLPDLYERKLVL